MGQTLRILADGFNKLHYFEDYDDDDEDHHHHHHHHAQYHHNRQKHSFASYSKFPMPDLANWPPELSLHVLSNLNATDLCLAACVWTELARDDVLWHSLCCSQWGYLTCYFSPKPTNFSYHKLYLTLDEASITFNADCQLGMEYFFKYRLLRDEPKEIAQFFYRAKPLDRTQMRRYLESRPEILDSLVDLQDFGNQSLPDALRQFFRTLGAPDKYDRYMHLMMEKFSARFAQCNRGDRSLRNQTPETIYLLCFSLIMLSVDLGNPHIKNKMSKREFIRNVRRAIHIMDDEMYGHLYDDIYLRGHIANASRTPVSSAK